MNATMRARLLSAREEISEHLEKGILEFWLRKGIDSVYGGFLTCFDEQGEPGMDVDKYIVTQTRMIWGFSALSQEYPERRELAVAAKAGFDFFIRHFWDEAEGGWYWKVAREGKAIDTGKVVYGQSFAIYALAEYGLAIGDPRGLDYASRTFDLLQKYCADTARGGYYENLECDWRLADKGFAAGDRKSLDIHMHLMEAFTTLASLSGKGIHRRKLEEVIEIILGRMVDIESGCGMNQFDLEFNPIPAIDIKRTWNAERAKGEILSKPLDSTSYGHNVELVWLLNLALEVLGKSIEPYVQRERNLLAHTLTFGYDDELGGVYRDGPHHGRALVLDKEWWQNCEALVGFLDGFERFGDEACASAFLRTWSFAKDHFINREMGEWRQLLDREGRVIAGNLGNPWKAIYHSGRAMLECRRRLSRLVE